MAEKRFWAISIKKSLIALCLVFLIGFAFDYFTASDRYKAPFAAGFISIAIFVVANLGVILINVVSHAVYLWLFNGRDMEDAILDDFRRAKLPPPTEYDLKRFEYLQELADDVDADPNDRVKAAVLFGGYNTAMSRGLFASLSMRRALDGAILRYSHEAARKA